MIDWNKILIHLIWATALTLITVSLYLGLAWVNSPTTWNFNVNMVTDNNTLELFRTINITRGVSP